MPKLASDLPSAPRDGLEPDVGRTVGDLAERMRGTVTPVIGYLELMSLEGHAPPTDRHLTWIATIERRLEAMRELNDQIATICDVMRDSVSDREAELRRAPEAPAD